MSTLREFTNVQCPFEDAASRLLSHFADGKGSISLRVRIADLRIERDVDIRLAAKPAYPGYKILDVHWAPKDGGPYPAFDGTLSIAEDGIGWSRIEIDGTYRAPFGLVGAAFDALVGHRIAQDTATELLEQIKRILTTPAAV
jgi:hypothetical protein